MRIFRYLLLLASAFILASCATKYVAMSNSIFSDHTGYWDSPIDSSSYEVTFAGNEYTPIETVNRYALYRAAELTAQRGYDYFVVEDGVNTSNTVMHTGPTMTHTSPPMMSTDPVSGTTTTTTVTTTSQDIYYGTKHSVTKTIRMFKGTMSANATNAYNAKSMINVMSPTVQR